MPDMVVYYDDEFVMAYTYPDSQHVLDVDGHKLGYQILSVKKVGAAAYTICWDDNGLEQEEDTFPAGVEVSSFTAGVIAAKRALKKVLNRCEQGWKGRIRLLTDSKSMVDGLRKSSRTQTSSLQSVSQILSAISEREECSIDIVQIPCHCGLPQNERVDILAKQGLSTSSKDQIEVPIYFEDAKTRIMAGSKAKPFISDVAGQLEDIISFRKAEVTLFQIYVGHNPKLHLVATYTERKPSQCYCSIHATNDVEHFVLRCAKRTESTRRELPAPAERRWCKTLAEIVR